MTRVGFIGARGHRALAQVWRRVRERAPDGIHIVSGGADGVDTVAELAARQCALGVTVHPAQWEREDGTTDRSAGLRRNTDIVAYCDEVEAFPWPECRGTWDTVKKAQAAGKPVRVHEPDVERQALLVFSAQRAYRGRGGFCVMRFGGGPEAEPFAPSAELLKPALEAREQANELRKAARQIASAQLRLGEAPEVRADRERRAAELEAQAEAMEEAMFADYRRHFTAEMRVSCGLTRGTPAWARRPAAERELHEAAWSRGVRPHPEAWRRLLARSFVTITCSCADPARCHRGILRSEILPALGAVDGGEVPCR